MFYLCAIDNVGYGRRLYMQKNGYWGNSRGKFSERLMRFETEDEALEYAWEKTPYRIYGAEYFVEEIED